jgi:ABC-type sugar transport system ATPase subunit
VSYVDIEKTFGSVRALHSTNLDIKPGEFFAVLGPSGSGKSTLLGIAAGYIAPTRGQLRLDDQNIVGEPPYRRNIGMVFQNYSLFPHIREFPYITGAACAHESPRHAEDGGTTGVFERSMPPSAGRTKDFRSRKKLQAD